MKFGTALFYKRLSSKPEFCENRLTDSCTLFEGITGLIALLSSFFVDVGEIHFIRCSCNVIT